MAAGPAPEWLCDVPAGAALFGGRPLGQRRKAAPYLGKSPRQRYASPTTNVAKDTGARGCSGVAAFPGDDAGASSLLAKRPATTQTQPLWRPTEGFPESPMSLENPSFIIQF